MEQIKQRALTYSLLAHIRSKGQLVGGLVEVFTPLIKRSLSKLNEKGIFSGKSITEIKIETDNLYSIDFPIPVLRTLLGKIAKEINTPEEKHFELFQDDSFQIKNYAFTEFEDAVRIQKIELENLEKLFKEFCETNGNENFHTTSILEFIEKNKVTLSKYLAHKRLGKTKDFSIEAQFVAFFKQIPPIYEIIRKIYLGSLIVSYIEYKIENVKTDIELLIDTNFLLGLLDLNTPESTHTCRKIIEITKSQGYKLSILRDTINETVYLLKAKAENFNTTFLQKKIYPEDIYNACDRRNLNAVDLERISDNLDQSLNELGIGIIYETSKYKNLAKFSREFEVLKNYRQTEQSALHDATAIYYVRQKRTKYIKDFEDVNCWFINNSVSRDKYTEWEKNTERGYQPEIIKADDFLNIIWLSSPQIEKAVKYSEVADIGLTSLISLGINSTLPKLSIIKELDDNIHKYTQESGLTDKDIIRVATRITTKQLTDIEDLNKLAKEDKEKFVKRLNEEAVKQKELDDKKVEKLDKVLKDFVKKTEFLDKMKSDFENKVKNIDEKLSTSSIELERKDKTIEFLTSQLEQEKINREKSENKNREALRESYINDEIKKWRNKIYIDFTIWVFCMVVGVITLLYFSSWNINNTIHLCKELKANILVSSVVFLLGAIFTGVTIKKWYDRNHNYSNIENYKKYIKIPVELRDIE